MRSQSLVVALAVLGLATPVLATPVPSASASPPAPASADPLPTATIHMHDFTFVPKTLTVAVGTTVTIVNDDDEAHTARAVDGAFSSGGLDRSDTWHHVFTTPGTHAYFCELHPYMKGTIVIVRAKENR